MLTKPLLDDLLKRVDSKYTLVTLAAKRAREITDGDEPLVRIETNKPVSIALEEINQGKITYESTKAGIK
jgi:DNA-directed RNA polymerase subunit omega